MKYYTVIGTTFITNVKIIIKINIFMTRLKLLYFKNTTDTNKLDKCNSFYKEYQLTLVWQQIIVNSQLYNLFCFGTRQVYKKPTFLTVTILTC